VPCVWTQGTATAVSEGELHIIEADDATMTVECQDCLEVYLVEPDAFGDGCMTYYVGFLTGNG
jgi:hypothetical protein